MLWLIAVHFAAACCAPPLVRRLGRRAFWALAAAPAAAAIWAAVHYRTVADGGELREHTEWIGSLGVSLALRCDALALEMVLIAGGIGALVMIYCAGYFADDEPRLGAFAGSLTAFAGAMLGLVLADDLIVLYVLWELTTVFSFLLIGHDPERRTNRRAALQALLVTTLGGLVMLVGFLMLGHAAGTFRISRLLADPPDSSALVAAGLVLVLAGALSKSAVWPFSFWLPGAMAAPTPVSAYLHAAAMVKAGVYLVARFAPAFADVTPWRAVVLLLGSVTMLLGGWRALRETDLKRLLAFGTVSQLGFLTLLAGDGTRDAELAGTAMILAHALFKASLFLVVGAIDHLTGTRDLERLSGLGRALPTLCAVACAAGLSMAGLPPLLGFAAKEAAVSALLHGDTAETWALAAVIAGSALTVAYTLRFLWGAFATKRNPAPPLRPVPVPAGTTTGALLLMPPLLCAFAGLLLGPAAPWLDPLLARHAETAPGGAAPFHLELWHGWGPALGLSALSWLLGAALHLARRPLAAAGDRLSQVDGDQVFARSLWGLERLSLQVTGSVQRGSLPVYLGTALVVLLGFETAQLLAGRPWATAGPVRWYDSVPQLVVAIGVAAVAVLCVLARQRMKAAVLAGVTGYGAGLLYVLHGAPDLALTQFAVETVSLTVFVLVLRRLPARFPDSSRTWRLRRGLQVVFSVAAGGLVAALLVFSLAARSGPAAGPQLLPATAHEGVRNVVATTLVDLRAWDTMGESAVLAAAAVGVTSLVYLRRRARVPVAQPVPGSEGPGGGRPPAPVVGPGAPPGSAAAESAAGSASMALDRDAGAQAPEPPGPAGRWDAWKQPVRLGTRPHGSPVAPRRTWLAASSTLAPEGRSVMFEVVARLVFHPILVLSLYLLFSAENLPGGGFTAGLVAGLALAVRYLAGGRLELAAAAPVDAGFLLGLGLLILTGTGLAGLWLGGNVLASGKVTGEIWLAGHFHAASPVLFDSGVYLLVLGVVLDVLRSLGSEIDRRMERDRARQAAEEEDQRERRAREGGGASGSDISGGGASGGGASPGGGPQDGGGPQGGGASPGGGRHGGGGPQDAGWQDGGAQGGAPQGEGRSSGGGTQGGTPQDGGAPQGSDGRQGGGASPGGASDGGGPQGGGGPEGDGPQDGGPQGGSPREGGGPQGRGPHGGTPPEGRGPQDGSPQDGRGPEGGSPRDGRGPEGGAPRDGGGPHGGAPHGGAPQDDSGPQGNHGPQGGRGPQGGGG
ncbi:Na+/H+ antiporter subunit A [Streptomyces albus]|uniref:Na+/H+ antiporter subunit A n=1 Tax=Streptomyces albus TaxID=1888 RepID=UPI0024E0449B|nr:Na+/H+ antiporter subunit A [Streptomyces albus]GHJ19768.1 Na+/H+ antiporter subunit A [Streptomyces albus]